MDAVGVDGTVQGQSGRGGVVRGEEDGEMGKRPAWKTAFHPMLLQAYLMILLWPIVQSILWVVGAEAGKHRAGDLMLGTVLFICLSLGFGQVGSLPAPWVPTRSPCGRSVGRPAGGEEDCRRL